VAHGVRVGVGRGVATTDGDAVGTAVAVELATSLELDIVVEPVGKLDLGGRQGGGCNTNLEEVS